MKKYNFLILILWYIFINTNAHGTIARVKSLGGLDTSLYYVNDTQNIFKNPAFINLNKNYLTFEWGEDFSGPNVSTEKPKAQGGFFKSFGYFNAGIFLGREYGTAYREEIIENSQLLYPDNSVDIFIGGDAGVEWGGSVSYSKNTDFTTGIEKTQSTLNISIGALTGPYEPYVNVLIYDQSKGGTSNLEEYKSSVGLTLGLNYVHELFIAHAEYSKRGHEYNRSEDGLKDRLLETRHIALGLGMNQQINDLAKMFIDLTFKETSYRKEFSILTTKSKAIYRIWILPLTVALETQVKDWLSLRASLKQNILSREKNDSLQKKTSKNSTEINVGASLHIDKLQIDGLLGSTDSKGEHRKSGTLGLNNILTQVSLSYYF